MSVDPSKVLVMGLSSLTDRADALTPNASNYLKIVDPCRHHTPAGDRDVPPTAATFSHDADFTRCVPGCPGEEGDPHQDRMWETNGLPVAGETMIYMFVAPLHTLLRGWSWSVFTPVPGLVMEVVVSTFGGLHGGTKEESVEHVVAEIDMSECNSGYVSACTVLEPTKAGSGDVYVENNYRVYLRVKAIDSPAQIKCAKFQVNQLIQCLTNAAPLMTPMDYAEATRSYPGLGGQDMASAFDAK